MIAARQIAAPDRTCEQHVADEGDLCAFMKEHDVAWRVSRAMAHAERRLADTDDVAVLKPAARRAVFRVGKSRTPGIATKAVEQGCIVLVRAFDRNGKFARQLGRAARMVEMAMRQKDFFQLDAFLGQRLPDPVEISARIDYRTPHGARNRSWRRSRPD